MRPHHHGPHGRWRASPQARGRWRLALGIHRRVLTFLLVAVLLGALVGWQLHAIERDGFSAPRLFLLAAWVIAVWPLAWVATLHIARPLAELARVAGALRDGRLSGRAELNASDDEVGQVAGALDAMAGRVAQQLDDQRALLAAVSHELRSPLARVRVMVELAREGRATDDLHDDLQSEIDGMDALVGDLLAGARIDFEALDPQPVTARELALRALELERLPADLLGGDASDRVVKADVTLFTRALRGLLENGGRHGGRVVALTVRAQDERVRFTVDDDGPGFAPGEEEQVFQPFWRRPPKPGEPVAQGTGLGLALVRQIARAHSGAAGANHRAGGGGSAWIEIPGID